MDFSHAVKEVTPHKITPEPQVVQWITIRSVSEKEVVVSASCILGHLFLKKVNGLHLNTDVISASDIQEDQFQCLNGLMKDVAVVSASNIQSHLPF